MSTYQHFARHYPNSPYTRFTEKVIREVFPHWLELLDFQPEALLDLGCGSGEFAIAQAKAGLKVSGLDLSKSILRIAAEHAKTEGADVKWANASMAEFSLPERFDCVTSWFDSLNYLLKIDDLAKTFRNAYAHLNPGGYFIFDMNTIYGLLVEWQRNRYFIQQETSDYLEVCQNSCDYENQIAEYRVIMFERNGKSWTRHEELHQERGYAVDDILLLLQSAGFKVRYLVGDPLLMQELGQEDGRLWLAAQKAG